MNQELSQQRRPMSSAKLKIQAAKDLDEKITTQEVVEIEVKKISMELVDNIIFNFSIKSVES
jgi:hypothetical protein